MAVETIRHRFKKGETYTLDQIYDIQGIIPNEAYDQDDIGDWTIINDNDSGETVRFVKNVELTIKIKITP